MLEGWGGTQPYLSRMLKKAASTKKVEVQVEIKTG